MTKSRMAKQEFDKKKAELCQKWERLMEKDTEISKAIALKKAEREMLNIELEKVEKKYGELEKDFYEPRVFGEKVENAKTKR